MVSVAVATLPKRSAFATLVRLLRSQLLQLVLALRSASRSQFLSRAAVAGSAYAALALALRGFCTTPWQLPGVAARIVYTVAHTLCEYASRGFRPLFHEWTLAFELVRAVTRTLTSNYGDRMLTTGCARYIRHQSDVAGLVLGQTAAWQHGAFTHRFSHNGLEHVWVRSPSPQPTTAVSDTTKPRRRVIVLYFHGGGYALLSPRLYIAFACELQHRVRDRLRDKLSLGEPVDVEILLANYRKIPEDMHPVPAQDCVAMYKYLLDDLQISPSHIIVAGDSAGGGLTMSTLLRVREENPALLPAAAIVSCPQVNLDFAGDERKAPHCIIGDKIGIAMLEAFHPRQGEPSTWGDASPVHCDLNGLPPVYIQAAEFDYILSQSKRLFEKAKEDGVTDWALEIFPNVPHVFSFFPPLILPSAARGLDAMAEYAATKFALSLQQAPSV